jgi:hypothetical protein
MKTIDWTKANDWIDSYIAHITNPNDIPTRYGRTWLELEAEKVGLVQDGRGWQFMECHAAWYAALIGTGRLYKVNSLEKQVLNKNQMDKTTTLSTVRKLLNGRSRNTITASMLRSMLAQQGKQIE